MTITAAQVRQARKLLRRSSAALSQQAGVGFTLVLQAQLDAVDSEALAALKRSGGRVHGRRRPAQASQGARGA